MEIVTLAHHIDLAWMYEAYRQTRKDGAAGMDEVTAAEYAEDLDANLRSLLERFPLPSAQVVHSICRYAANPCL